MRRLVSTTRLLFASVISMVTIGSVSILMPTPAQASTVHNTLYPSGCNQETQGSWHPSCWVGYDYVKASTSVLAVQYVLRASGHSPGTPDCEYGSNSDNAAIAYQRANGLEQDGIVGGNTWGSMQGWTHSSGISDEYGTYYNVGSDGLRFYWEGALGGYWLVLDPYYPGPNQYVQVAGYASQNLSGFCP